MISQSIHSAIRDSFFSCEEVDPAFFRCEKRFENHVRGVYFIDTSDQLPTVARLEQINASFVAPSYFRSNDTSRWNHYLIWVASDEKRRDVAFAVNRKALEDNKDYARKLVVFESDFSDFIHNGVEGGTDSGPAESIVSVWGKILGESGLSEIPSDIARTKVIQKIRSTDPVTVTKKVPKSTKGISPDPRLTKTLASISIKKFGNRTIQGDFSFSQVNLIRGVNGTGKTSLLEALEHFFCGSTRRARADDKVETLDASITFLGEQSPVKYSLENNADYQARDLTWYGRNINKGNALCEGFARYNFLDTDSAVRFATDNHASELSELLALVALGPEVSRTWARIGEFVDDIDRDLISLKKSVRKLKSDLADARKRVAALQEMAPNTQALVSVIQSHPLANGWKLSNPGGTSPELDWFENVVPLRSLVQRLNRLPGIATLADIDFSLSQTQQDIESLKEKYDAASKAKEQIKGAKYRIADGEKNLKSLTRLSEYLHANFGALVTRKSDLQRSAAETPIKSPDKAMLLVAILKVLPNASRTLPVVRQGLDRELASARSRLSESSERQRELSANLGVRESIRLQIRQLGKEYVQAHHELDDCPLCRTVMNAQTLLKRIEAAVDATPKHEETEQVTAQNALLIKQVSQLSDASQAITAAAVLFPSLESAPLTQVIAAIEEAITGVVELSSQIERVKGDLDRLGSSGFSQSEYDHCALTTRAYATTLQRQAPTNETEVWGLRDLLTKKLSDEKLALQEFESQIATIRSQIQTISIRYSSDLDPENDQDAIFKRLNERIDDFMGLRIDLAKLHIGTIPTMGENLRIFSSQAAELIERVDALSLALKDEKSKATELAVLQPQVVRDEARFLKEDAEVARLQNALKILKDLQSNHSLESGLGEFFSKHFTAIQKIFSRIHVPNELRLTSDHSGALERVCGEASQRVSLGQVSTGQRAAFVLSVFSMLNLSLRNAPPIMLIDDPIAHVDDLNCLSYLDFIADVAETNRRQIFFATANEKLGNLFEKKLGYLGDGLRVIDMR